MIVEDHSTFVGCQSASGQGIGVIPWSPLARGLPGRPWDATTAPSEADEFGQRLYQPEDRDIVDRLVALTEARGVSPAQIASAGLMARPAVDLPRAHVNCFS